MFCSTLSLLSANCFLHYSDYDEEKGSWRRWMRNHLWEWKFRWWGGYVVWKLPWRKNKKWRKRKDQKFSFFLRLLLCLHQRFPCENGACSKSKYFFWAQYFFCQPIKALVPSGRHFWKPTGQIGIKNDFGPPDHRYCRALSSILCNELKLCRKEQIVIEPEKEAD